LVRLRYPVAAAGFLVPHSLLICGNDGTRGDEVARRLGIDLSRFRFWQNGVDVPEHPPETSREEFVGQFGSNGFRPESKWVVSCSRLTYWKRIDRMLRALSHAKRAGCDCQLLVAGEGEERARLSELAKELGVEEDVVWLGALAHDQIWSLMHVADVFMITNDVTNRCNPVYEAMCAALPVVSVEDPSTSDLLEHEVNALLSDKDDDEALGRHLHRACTDEDLARLMGNAQRQRAKQLWSWRERMAREVEELEAIVESRRASAA
jgi:glycosyltransferase involved in cell wall biosynthesis